MLFISEITLVTQKVFNWVEVRNLRSSLEFFQSSLVETYFNGHKRCHDKAGVGLLVSVKRQFNATEYKAILHSVSFQLCGFQQVGEDPHKNMMIRCAHIVAHIVCIQYNLLVLQYGVFSPFDVLPYIKISFIKKKK